MAVRPLDAVYPVMFIDAIDGQGPRRQGRQPADLRRDRGDRGRGPATSSGCGPATGGGGIWNEHRFVSADSVLLPEVFPPIGVSLIFKV